jgi:hypothetical protein
MLLALSAVYAYHLSFLKVDDSLEGEINASPGAIALLVVAILFDVLFTLFALYACFTQLRVQTPKSHTSVVHDALSVLLSLFTPILTSFYAFIMGNLQPQQG